MNNAPFKRFLLFPNTSDPYKFRSVRPCSQRSDFSLQHTRLIMAHRLISAAASFLFRLLPQLTATKSEPNWCWHTLASFLVALSRRVEKWRGLDGWMASWTGYCTRDMISLRELVTMNHSKKANVRLPWWLINLPRRWSSSSRTFILTVLLLASKLNTSTLG